MLREQIEAAIAAARTGVVLDALARATWSGMAGGHISEDDASGLSATLEARRKEMRTFTTAVPATFTKEHSLRRGEFKREQTMFARARVQRPPDRAASLARRRHLAASGPMPPALAARFTTGELAVLRIVADEVRDKGRCDRTYAELAARGGVGRTTARNAVRTAARLGLLHIEERPRPGRKHLANLVTLTSREWKAWIDRRPARPKEPISRPASARVPRPTGLIGVKKPSTTVRRF